MNVKRKRYTTGIPLGYSPSGRRRSGPLVHPLLTSGIGKRRRTTFRPGRDRVGGYYGRYAVGGKGELKFHDVGLLDAVVASGANITDSVCLIPQGITESNRVGRKCTITQINWRFQVQLPGVEAAVGPPNPEVLRVIMYLDRQCNGATITGTDLLETINQFSFRNLANSQRFSVLYDRVFDINALTMSTFQVNDFSTAPVIINDMFFKKVNIPLEFSGVTGAITELRSNNIGVMLLAVNGLMAFDSKIRLRFSDN